MKVFLTGATGFIGGHVARALRDRGDDVRVLVRSSAKAEPLVALGCEPVIGDLSDTAAIASGARGLRRGDPRRRRLRGGIPASEHRAMYESNVLGTENVLRAALEAQDAEGRLRLHDRRLRQHPRRGRRRDLRASRKDFTSYYEQTKYEAHRVAQRMIAEEGLPCVIVAARQASTAPTTTRRSARRSSDFVAGKLPLLPFPDLGMNMVHVEDVADGILLALDKGVPGEAYNLGGRNHDHARADRHRRRGPAASRRRGAMPTGLLKVLTPAGPVVGKVMGQPPNLRELISSADGRDLLGQARQGDGRRSATPRAAWRPGLRETLDGRGQALATRPGRSGASGAAGRGDGITTAAAITAAKAKPRGEALEATGADRVAEDDDAAEDRGAVGDDRGGGDHRDRLAELHPSGEREESADAADHGEHGPWARRSRCAPAIRMPSVSALIATLETPISRPEASPSTTPWQIEPRRRMPEAKSAQPAPTITVSNAARVAIE